MSWQRPVLNWVLRWTERPILERVRSPRILRANLEFKARLTFFAPRGCHTQMVDLEGVPALRIEPPDAVARRAILYLHGGGFVMGSPRIYRALATSLAKRTRAVVYLPDYRLAPEHPFPAAPDDCLRCYRRLAADYDIVIGGDSAGGGLTFTLLADLLRSKLPSPVAVFAFSPAVDLTYSAPSISNHASSDVVLPASRVVDVQVSYLAGHDQKDPRASPLFADFDNAPPVSIYVGDTEILFDDACGMTARLEASGCPTRLRISHDLPHVWPLFHNWLPEARETLDDLAGWLTHQWEASGEN